MGERAAAALSGGRRAGQRLARVAATEALTVYVWALVPNHFHLLVRTGRQPLARSMRSLLTGYAGAFNRRYRRNGHVFQNRYKEVARRGRQEAAYWEQLCADVKPEFPCNVP